MLKTQRSNIVAEVGVVFLWLFFAAIIFLYPLVGIWSLNTLFQLSIPFTLQTYLAAFILSGPFTSFVFSKNTNK